MLSALPQTVTSLEALDGSEGTWAKLKPMSSPRQDHVAAFANGRLYVIGGYSPTNPYARALAVEEYDPVADTWQDVATLTSQIVGAAACVYNDSIFVFGGQNWMDRTIGDSIRVFDPRSRTWTARGCMKEHRAFHQVVVLDDVFYIMGGMGGNSPYEDRAEVLGSVETYEPRSGQQVLGGMTMPSPRMYFGATVVDNAIVVMGGVSCYKCVPTVLDDAIRILPGSGGSWQAVSKKMPEARFGFGIATLGGAAYVIGGAPQINAQSSGVARYYP
jgi:N-acetylneuraminic acid mutarotase